jgi:general stress protein 26
MDNLKEMEGILKDLFTTQKLAVLATHTKEECYANLVAFASTGDLKSLLFATPRTTRKYTYLKAESRVAVLIDSRSHQDSDIHSAIAVTATGDAQEVGEGERDRLLKIYLDKHPHLEEFVTSPSCALIRVKVESYVAVSKFQEVRTLHLKR